MARRGLFSRLRIRIAAAAAIAANLNAFGLSVRNVCAPGMSCHGCPWSTAACPVGVMTFGAALRTLPALAIGTIAAIGIGAGRIVCGYVCPFGLLQDFMHRIPGRKLSLPRWTRSVKYLALALLVFLLPLILGFQKEGFLGLETSNVDLGMPGTVDVSVTATNLGELPVSDPEVQFVYVSKLNGEELLRIPASFEGTEIPAGESRQLPAVNLPHMLVEADLQVWSSQSAVTQHPRYDLYYCKVCPVGTLTASLPAYAGADAGAMYSRLTGQALRLLILAVFLVGMVLISRPYCRTFCPLGALYGLLSPFALWRVTVDQQTCISCGACSRVCPVELDVQHEAGGPECISCGDCIGVCPKSSITRRFGLGGETKAGEQLDSPGTAEV